MQIQLLAVTAHDVWRLTSAILIILLALAIVGYAVWHGLQQSEDPVRIIVKGVITIGAFIFVIAAALAGPAGMFLGIVVAAFIGFMWAPHLGALVASPFTEMFEGSHDVVRVPLYSMAEARRKRGHYLEAVQEIRKQLADFPTDFPGQYMLAEIQAQDLHDLSAAHATIFEILAQPGHHQKNIVFALNRLADWQANDQQIVVAQETLERITKLFPESEDAQLAEQRIAHLGSAERALPTDRGAVIPLPHHEENVGLRPDFTGFKLPPEDPGLLAAQYVKQLETYPQDFETREKLALLYADQFQRADLAEVQLEQLIGHPHQPPKQVARWLNLLAEVQLRSGAEIERPHATLQRIIELYPNSAAAETALHRQRFLKIELKAHQKSEAIKLPATDQRLGLR